MDYLLSMDYLEPMYCGLSMDYLQNSGLSESMYYGLSMDYLQNSGLSENLPKPCFFFNSRIIWIICKRIISSWIICKRIISPDYLKSYLGLSPGIISPRDYLLWIILTGLTRDYRKGTTCSGLTVFFVEHEFHAIKFGKTEITPILEGFRTNQAHHSNRLGETDSFGEKIRKSFHYIIRR